MHYQGWVNPITRVGEAIRRELSAEDGADRVSRDEFAMFLSFGSFSGANIETVERLCRHTEVALQRAKRVDVNCDAYFRMGPGPKR